MRHTPEPWEIVRTEYKRETRVEILRQGYSEPIARVYHRGTCNGHRYTVPQDANARLIAAAPELLEALQAVLASDPGCYDVCGDGWLEAMTHARKAIAKALAVGESEART